MKNVNEKYYKGNERFNITHSNKTNKTDIDNIVKFKLPIITSEERYFNNQIVSMKKKQIENNFKSKYYKLFFLDSDGKLIIFESNDNFNDSEKDKFHLKKVFHSNLKSKIVTNQNNFLRCFDLNFSSKSNNYFDTIFILCNIGLIKLKLEGREDFIFNILYKNEDDYNKLSAFDVSDTGHIIAAFTDFTIKIFDEDYFTVLFQTNVNTLAFDTFIDKIYFANVICKNEYNKLIRKNILDNFYVVTSKNEFIIYDLNQKNDIKKIKKKIDLGGKKALTKRNSSIFFS